VFIAAYNAARGDLWAANFQKLKALRTRAVDVLAGVLDSDHEPTKLKAALSVLDLSTGVPEGPTTATGVEEQWKAEQVAKEKSDKFEELFDF